MRLAVINFSGNVGKTTVARHLLAPRIPGCQVVAVESINADDGQSVTIRGRQFAQLQEFLQSVGNVVIDIGDDQLAKHPYMLGERYTLVDMAVWGWARAVPFLLGADAWEKLPNVKRLLDEINARPAAQRAEALKTRHAFKTEMDDDARKAMFPQNARLAV